MTFIGRDKELDTLKRLLLKKTASLVVIWGRRRIGKSRLVEEFTKNKKVWNFAGLPPQLHKTKQEEIDYFVQQMSQNIGMPELKTSEWSEVFWHLGIQAQKEKPSVIFFDEISWMGSKDPNFLGYLKTEWDKTFSRCPSLIFILCGSVSNWIEENIIKSSGFYGRISTDMRIEELPLSDCNKFWNAHKDRISPYEKFKILCVTGGIPKYLEEIITTESAETNINHLCFQKEGLLFREYNQIFYDLFSKKAGSYDKIARLLAEGVKNIDEICSLLNIEKSGNISQYMHDLVSVGFVAEDKTWNIVSKKNSNLKVFRLKDNYIRFYLKFIEPSIEKIDQGLTIQESITHFLNWESVMGLQFENLVINNLVRLCKALGISINDVEKAGPFFQRPTKRKKGCQIDLLIQTRSRSLYICEIKFSISKIGMDVVESVERKTNNLEYPKGYSIRPVLIHVNGISQKVVESHFFDKIVDFSEFLTA